MASAAATIALNLSSATQCAEEDNINVPIFGRIDRFVIAATHPATVVDWENCDADFTNCDFREEVT